MGVKRIGNPDFYRGVGADGRIVWRRHADQPSESRGAGDALRYLNNIDLGDEGWRWLGESRFGVAVFNGNDIAGQCEDVNGSWAAHVLLRGQNLMVDVVDYVAEDGGDAPEGYAHTVAVINGEVWDWSYRQIDEAADVPVRMSVTEWEKTWDRRSRMHLTEDDAREILDDW